FAEIVRGLEDVAGASQYALFVSSSDRELDKEVAVLRAFVASQVDAIVLVASGMVGPEYLSAVSEVLGRFESLGGVVVSTSETSYPAPRVVFDNAGATRTMVEHLVELGHRQIAYLDGPEELQVCERRLAGFKAALDDPLSGWPRRAPRVGAAFGRLQGVVGYSGHPVRPEAGRTRRLLHRGWSPGLCPADRKSTAHRHPRRQRPHGHRCPRDARGTGDPGA